MKSILIIQSVIQGEVGVIFLCKFYVYIFRLCVKTKCLDVVYQTSAVRWLTEFLCLPHKRSITHLQIEAMKSRTKRELIKNWEQMLDGRLVSFIGILLNCVFICFFFLIFRQLEKVGSCN